MCALAGPTSLSSPPYLLVQPMHWAGPPSLAVQPWHSDAITGWQLLARMMHPPTHSFCRQGVVFMLSQGAGHEALPSPFHQSTPTVTTALQAAGPRPCHLPTTSAGAATPQAGRHTAPNTSSWWPPHPVMLATQQPASTSHLHRCRDDTAHTAPSTTSAPAGTHPPTHHQQPPHRLPMSTITASPSVAFPTSSLRQARSALAGYQRAPYSRPA